MLWSPVKSPCLTGCCPCHNLRWGEVIWEDGSAGGLVISSMALSSWAQCASHYPALFSRCMKRGQLNLRWKRSLDITVYGQHVGYILCFKCQIKVTPVRLRFDEYLTLFVFHVSHADRSIFGYAACYNTWVCHQHLEFLLSTISALFKGLHPLAGRLSPITVFGSVMDMLRSPGCPGLCLN